MSEFVDPETGARCHQTMVAMRDGTRLNTFVFLPADGERFPVILQRTPYGIAKQDGSANHDVSQGWLPSPVEPAARFDLTRLEEHYVARLRGCLPGYPWPVRVRGRGPCLCGRCVRWVGYVGVGIRARLDKRAGRDVRLVGGGDDDLCGGGDKTSLSESVLGASRRL